MKKEQLQIGPEIAPGVRTAIRRRGDEFKAGVIRESEHGRPVQPGSDLIEVFDVEDAEGWHDATVVYSSPRATSDGPPQVASDAYRTGYDKIFGRKPVVGVA